MRFEFTSCSITNFKSFSGTHDLDFSSFGVGLHFLRGRNTVEPRLGSNGSGKSSLWDAVCWCLYGKTPDGLRNPDVQPWAGKKLSHVQVKLLIDGKPYKIERQTNPNRFLLNDKETGQEKVDRLLGVNVDTFTHTVLLGQGQPLFFDLSAKGKMDLFSDVLELDRWDMRSKNASAKVHELETSQAGLVGELQGVEGQEKQITSLLVNVRQQSDEWEEDKQKRKVSDKKELEVLIKRREKVIKERAKFDLEYDGALTELRALHTQVKVFEKQLLAKRTQLSVLTTEQNAYQEEIELLGDAKKCPTCGQSLKNAGMVVNHKNELVKKLRALAPIISVQAAQVTDAETRLERHQEDSAVFQKKADTARDNFDHLTPELTGLEIKIKTIEDVGKDEQANPYTAQIAKLRRDKQSLVTKQKDLNDRLIMLTAQMERTKFWVKGFKDVRLYVVEEVLQELELTTNAGLQDVGLLDWQIQYAIEKETKSGTIQRGLNVSIISPRNKNAVKWESFSGGERQRLRVVGALALSEVLLGRAGVETNMEILDEPTQHLSEQGVRDLCDYLATRAKEQSKQIWYADHQSVQSTRFTSVLTVIKDKKGSYLEV